MMNNDERENKCTYYNKKKRRFCDHEIDPNVPEQLISSSQSDLKKFKPIYCFQHRSIYSALWKEQKGLKSLHNSGTSCKNVRRRRIPCPLDPSHMIYEDKKEIHITKKCPKIKLLNKERQQIYYQQNVNTLGSGPRQFCRDCTQEMKKVNLQILAQQILTVYKNIFLSQSTKDIEFLTEEDIYNAIPTENHFPLEKSLGLEASLLNVKIGGHKHLEQIGSIIGHARKCNLLQDTKVILEMGAGRATTGVVMSGVVSAKTSQKEERGVELILIEKSGSRAKADIAVMKKQKQHRLQQQAEDKVNDIEIISTNAIKDEELDLKKSRQEYIDLKHVRVERIRCDLAHINIPKSLEKSMTMQQIPHGSKSNRILVIAKHLCGAGTDLALKSIMPSIQQQHIKGCIFTTCCHGICDWEHYVGREYLGQAFCKPPISTLDDEVESLSSFGKDEFDTMKRWACGTIIHERDDEPRKRYSDNNEIQVETHSSALPTTENNEEIMSVHQVILALKLKCGPRGLGRACQRLIDYGRCEYLRKLPVETSFSKVKLCHYVDSSITPQNAMILCQFLNKSE